MAKKQFPKSMNGGITEDPEVILDDTISERVRNEFVEHFKNLSRDIDHIDNRMSHIQKFITNLDTQVQHIQNLINSDDNPGKKGSYFQIMNSFVLM